MIALMKIKIKNEQLEIAIQNPGAASRPQSKIKITTFWFSPATASRPVKRSQA
jgi:hypothetical protein